MGTFSLLDLVGKPHPSLASSWCAAGYSLKDDLRWPDNVVYWCISSESCGVGASRSA